VAEHEMHTEVIEIHKNTIELLLSNIGNIIAVGTTSVRTLESLYYIGLQLEKSEPNPQHLSQGREEQENRINILHVSQWAPYEANKTISTEVALNNILNYLNKENRTALHAETQIMIKPGYQFKIVKGIITNFHQPKSTLLLLVSAFVNGKWKKIYDFAYKNDYRFLSYGDSSLLFNE
jgi:S-adenosylmethionine:tRNA ribosyltransferase-isomerase